MAIERTSKGAFAELHPRAARVVAAAFLRRVLDKRPYKGHTVPPDNGVQFTPRPPQFLPGGHRVDRICRAYGVEHRLSKPAHLWTNGPVERPNRSSKEATAQRFHYPTTDELNGPLQAAGLPSRQALEGPARADPTRICLCSVAKDPDHLYPGPDPADPGTIHYAHYVSGDPFHNIDYKPASGSMLPTAKNLANL